MTAPTQADYDNVVRERDEYAAAASRLLLIYDLHVDQRLQGAPANIAQADPWRLILGQNPCRIGRTQAEFDAVCAEFDAVRAMNPRHT